MLLLVVVLAVATVASFVALVRASSRESELRSRLEDADIALDVARGEGAAAEERADRAEVERDDALERVNRTRRDAAEVANRLRDETDARSSLEEALAELRAEVEAHECPRPDPVEVEGGAGVDADVLWGLALGQVEQTWRVSLAVGGAVDSPLAGAPDLFHRAVEIEVDAAREESGADLELRWEGDAVEPAPRQAVLAWALIRDVITRHATAASHTELAVRTDDGGVEVLVSVVDDEGRPRPVRLPAPLEVEPGRALVR